MSQEPAIQRVEATFAVIPPSRRINQASGVTDVEVEGHTVRCLIYGSFQPFLEAVRGYEVLSLTAIPAVDGTKPSDKEDEH